MFVHRETYTIAIARTEREDGGHFIVWEKLGGKPLMRINHVRIVRFDGTIGIKLMGESHDGILVESIWWDFAVRSHDTGFHSFLIEVGILLGRAEERRRSTHRGEDDE